jgi:large subunit ribosomal protein L19
MHPAIINLDKQNKKPAVAKVQTGDTVRVHQFIREGNKQRIQVFEGVVIRTDRMGSSTASITVRRIASGVGVEKSFLLHSPNVDKVEVMRRGKVRRKFISFLRERRGKSARLKEVAIDRNAVNVAPVKAEEISDPIADEEVIEVDVDQNQDELNQADVSTEEIAKEENKEAAADEPKNDPDAADSGDEGVMPAEEAESGVDKAQPKE